MIGLATLENHSRHHFVCQIPAQLTNVSLVQNRLEPKPYRLRINCDLIRSDPARSTRISPLNIRETNQWLGSIGSPGASVGVRDEIFDNLNVLLEGS